MAASLLPVAVIAAALVLRTSLHEIRALAALAGSGAPT